MKWDWNKFLDQAYTWIITTGPRIVLALILLFVGLWLIRVVNRGLKKTLDRRKFNPTLRYFLQNLFAIILQILLILLVMQVAGIELTFLAAIIAGLSVAAGLALSGTLQNFVSGILILLWKPYRVGDIISTSGQEGNVSSIQLFFTTVQTYDNKTITIPNGKLSNDVVTNLTKEGKRRIDISMKFNYGIDFDQVKTVAEATISKVKNLLPEPVPRVGVADLEADKYTVAINVWTEAHGFIDTKMELQEALLKELRASGIKLPGMS